MDWYLRQGNFAVWPVSCGIVGFPECLELPGALIIQRNHVEDSIMKERKAIVSAIASIRTRSGKLAVSIHETAVDCLVHADMHGDLTLLTKLHEAVGPTMQKRLRAWVIEFAPVTFHDGQFKKVKGSEKLFDLGTAAEVSPDDLSGSPKLKAVVDFSAVAEIERLKKYLLKVQKNLTTNEVGGYDDALAKIADVIDSMETA